MRFDFGYTEEDHLGKPYDLMLLRRLMPFLRPYRRLLVVSVVLIVALTLFELALPYFSKVAIDRYIVPTGDDAEASPSQSGDHARRRFLAVDAADPRIRAVVDAHPELFHPFNRKVRIAFNDLKRLSPADLKILRYKDMAGLTWVVIVFLGVVITDFALTFLQRMVMEYAGHKVMHDLRLGLYLHIQQQSMAFFTRQPVARLVTRMTNDVQNMYELFTTFIAMVFKDFFLLTGIAVVLLALDWRLTLAGFAVLPLVVWTSMRFSTLARDVFRALRVKVAEINSRVAETIEGIKTIQAFGREAANYRHFAELNAENYRLGMRQIHIFAIFMPIIEVLGITSTAILILYGGLHVRNEAISLGTLVAAISYMRLFFRPLRDLAENYNVLQNAMASAERIFGLMDTDQRLPQVPEAPIDSEHDGGRLQSVELRGVHFGYVPGEWVLNDVSITLTAGQTVALVGPTGAGKTSVLNLIMRLYDSAAGRVCINGVDVRQWGLSRLRSMMAYVPQDPVLFSGTLRENIFPDAAAVDDASVSRIIEAANCRLILDRLPMGLDSMLVKSGSELSSGERQLVAIARALARDPQLILLDEATSYIDSQTEAAIYKALQNLLVGRTGVLVAHRLSTARAADKIIVIKHGRVVESGSHDQLMDARSHYWRLNRQSAEGLGLAE
jgi:ATP-binding cassette, subfamily B, multidrug efflux pump